MKSSKLTNTLLGVIALNLSILTFMKMIPEAQAQKGNKPMEVKLVAVELNHRIEADNQKIPVTLEGYEGLYLEYLRTGHPIPVKILDK